MTEVSTADVEALVAKRTEGLDAMNAKLVALQEDIKTEAKQIFGEASKEIFAGTEDLGEFGWTQYTPYFNDGDPCVFSVHEIYIHAAGDEDMASNYWESSDGFCRYGSGRDNPTVAAIEKLRGSLNKDTLEALFGDHAVVRVTRDGVEVEEYEHD